jgi:hypothetical protein
MNAICSFGTICTQVGDVICVETCSLLIQHNKKTRVVLIEICHFSLNSEISMTMVVVQY